MEIDCYVCGAIKFTDAPSAIAKFSDEVSVSVNGLDATISCVRDVEDTPMVKCQADRLKELSGTLPGAPNNPNIVYTKYLWCREVLGGGDYLGDYNCWRCGRFSTRTVRLFLPIVVVLNNGGVEGEGEAARATSLRLWFLLGETIVRTSLSLF